MNGKTYDLVTVGGGLAGASVATVMARAGARVLVLEKETQFRDRVRGEFLAPWAVRDVEQLGLIETMLEAGAIPLPALAGRSLKPRPVVTPDGDVPLSFSHVAAQEALLTAAREAGADVIRGARVTGVSTRGAGDVSFQTPDGGGSVRARVVVGADGRSSLVRKALARPEHTHRTARLLAGVRLANVPADPSFGYFVIREEAGALVSLFPQADGFARAYVFEHGKDASAYSGPGAYARFMDAMVAHGIPREALMGARQAGPLAAFVADDSWVEHPAGGPLVLVGDAAGISDPTWGQGMALAFHDAATLTAKLKATSDWRDATSAFARERDRYYRTVVTLEDWLTELQLTPGAEADARRARVMVAWKREPARAQALDLPGRGPSLDISEATRRWIFAEDEVETATVSTAAVSLPEPPHIGTQFLEAVTSRDFGALRRLIDRKARVRALLPGGPVELRGPERTEGAFAHWLGGLEDFNPLSSSSEMVGDRLKLCWQASVRWKGERFRRVVEQLAYAKVVDGRIAVMDLLCSEFRPLEGEAA